jgi:uncharacterized protein YecT (DUF1311 family)
MSRWQILFVLLFSITFSKASFGQCEGSTVDVTNSFEKEFRQADLDLNKTYKLALKDLQESDAALLRKAQRAWIAYRDAQCDAEYAKWGGGSGGPGGHLQCLATITEERIVRLRKTYLLDK